MLVEVDVVEFWNNTWRNITDQHPTCMSPQKNDQSMSQNQLVLVDGRNRLGYIIASVVYLMIKIISIDFGVLGSYARLTHNASC